MPEAHACGTYELDLTGTSYGSCVCGFGRNKHGKAVPAIDRVYNVANMASYPSYRSPSVDRKSLTASCAHFELDLCGSTYGICKCGYTRIEHEKAVPNLTDLSQWKDDDEDDLPPLEPAKKSTKVKPTKVKPKSIRADTREFSVALESKLADLALRIEETQAAEAEEDSSQENALQEEEQQQQQQQQQGRVMVAGFAVKSLRPGRQWSLVEGPWSETEWKQEEQQTQQQLQETAAVGGEDGKIALWDLSRGKVKHELEGHAEQQKQKKQTNPKQQKQEEERQQEKREEEEEQQQQQEKQQQEQQHQQQRQQQEAVDEGGGEEKKKRKSKKKKQQPKILAYDAIFSEEGKLGVSWGKHRIERIKSVAEGSYAARLGMGAGDLLVKVNGEPLVEKICAKDFQKLMLGLTRPFTLTFESDL
jgi:hypothetical protein